MQTVIGIDLGGTNIRLARVNSEGHVLDKTSSLTLVEKGPDAVIQQMVDGVNLLVSRTSDPILGVGVGIAGMLDTASGVVNLGPNLKWVNVPLVAKLQQALSVPIKMINDVRAATLGELLFGAGKNCADFVCVMIGTGIGGGVVSRGSLMTGFHGNFGEIGHFLIDIHGRPCTCGRFGCLEAYAGGWGMAARAKALSQNQREWHVKEIVAGFYAKEAIAVQVIEEAIEALVAGIETILYAYNPSKIIFGGGIIENFPELMEELEKRVRLTMPSGFMKGVHFVRTYLKEECGLIGAAATFFYSNR